MKRYILEVAYMVPNFTQKNFRNILIYKNWHNADFQKNSEAKDFQTINTLEKEIKFSVSFNGKLSAGARPCVSIEDAIYRYTVVNAGGAKQAPSASALYFETFKLWLWRWI